MARQWLALLCVLVVVGFTTATPLDDYVNAADNTYSYNVTTTLRLVDATVYNLFLTSQTWLTDKDSSNAVWRHWLQICVPDRKRNTDVGLIFVDGGGTPDIRSPPTDVYLPVSFICQTAGFVAARISAIPNQPIVFSADPKQKRRSEDSVISFTWAHFLNHTDQPQWLLRLPMTKAVVRAMDTITKFTTALFKKENNDNKINIEENDNKVNAIQKFVIGGASKRGWTTWTTAAVDKRVVGIIPIVAPVGNLVPQMNEMWRSYGEWSFALGDYVDDNLLYYLNSKSFKQLLDIVDPLTYNTRLTMPKFVICSPGDEFFLTNAVNHMWPQLSEPKILRVVPNSEHSMAIHDIDLMLSVEHWLIALVEKTARPEYNWTISANGETIEVTVLNPQQLLPKRALLWTARNRQERDFRLIRCADIKNPKCINPKFWFPSQLNMTSDYKYIGHNPTPEEGWVAFLVSLEYPGNTKLDYFRVTTDVSIIPDKYPFPPCSDDQCNRPPPSF